MLLIFLLLVLGQAGQTGEIHGRVADQDGSGLPGVNVYVPGTRLGAATSTDGTYRIRLVPAGRYTLIASAVGYRQERTTVSVPEGGAVEADFVLREVAIEADEVVVTASRREQLAGTVAASVSTLTPRDIEARNAVSLDDALRYVPGVQLAGNQVNIRGSSGFSYNTGSRVLLLIDGMSMLRPDADGIPFDAIPMNQVERIEVLKGPGSALYGGGALGGVINVLTRDYPESPETFVEVFGGVYEPARYALWRQQWDGAEELRPLGGFTVGHSRRLGQSSGMWVNVSYRKSEGYLRLGKSENLQGYSKLTWRPSPVGRFNVLVGVTRRTSDSFLFWNGARDALNPGRIEFGQNDRDAGSDDYLTTELSLLPAYTQLIGSTMSATVKGRLFGVLIQPLDEDFKPKPVSAGTKGFRYGGEAQLNYSPSNRRFLTAGITGDANATRSSFYENDESRSQPEGAVFLQWEESASRRLNLVGGLRFDVYRIRSGVTERKLSPKLTAAYSASERVVVRAAFGEGFRVPSVTERFVSDQTYVPIVMNLDLKPEISRSYELGLRAYPALSLAGRDLSVVADAAVFWNDYWRLVEPTFVASEKAFQFVNLTRARVRGAEVTGKLASAGEKVTLEGGYTYLDSEDLSADQPLVFRSRHLLKLGAGTTLMGIKLGADYRYSSEPERVDSDFALFIPDATMMVPTRVLDLRVGTTWRSVTATLHVKNALDYYYLERPALLAAMRHYILQVAARF